MKIFNIILGVTIVFLIVMFLRCKKTTEVTELVKNTERIQVTFYNDTMPDSYIDITDKNDIKKFGSFISSQDVPLMKCGFDGELVFFMEAGVASGNNNSVLMQFNMENDCAHVEYTYAEQLQTKKLTDDGAQFLNDLKLKK